MNRRHAIWTALAALHLGLVAFCSAGLMPSFDNIPGQTLRWYGSMSGATNRYGFFKEVGTGCKVTFLLTDRSGRTWTDTLNQAGNREAEMRANGSVYMIHDLGHSLADACGLKAGLRTQSPAFSDKCGSKHARQRAS